MTGSSSVLPDANFWLALFLDRHRAHPVARAWLHQQSETVLVFCRVTQMAFLRHLTTKAIMGPNVLSQAKAWSQYETLLARDEVTFLGEPQGLEIRWRDYTQSKQSGHKLWTDAYLAAFAMAHGLPMLTFDQGFTRFTGVEQQILQMES